MAMSRKMILSAVVAALCIVLIFNNASAASITKSDSDEKLAAIATYKYGMSRQPLVAVEELIRESQDQPELRKHIGQQLAKLLESDATIECKSFICRQLWFVDSADSMPVLARMLTDEETVDMACYALCQDPSPEAGKALRDAMGKVQGNVIIPIVNLLGERHAAQSVDAISTLVFSDEAAVAEAAVAALGKIGGTRAASVLSEARAKGSPETRLAATHAYLQCAESLLAQDKKDEAVAIFKELAGADEPEPVRTAAVRGMAGLEGEQAPGNVPLFDGKTFTGWEGNLEVFRIENGAIVGGTLEKGLRQNEFLCTTKEYSDFELRLKVKLAGKGANGGIQLRSRRVPQRSEVMGYQADMGGPYWGCLYDEGRRRKILASADREKVEEVLRPDDWNDYVIRCVGNRIQLWFNGFRTVDYTEPESDIEQKGIIGLQVHAGVPMEAWYKDISIREITQ
jgi:HEAT repeat protein